MSSGKRKADDTGGSSASAKKQKDDDSVTKNVKIVKAKIHKYFHPSVKTITPPCTIGMWTDGGNWESFNEAFRWVVRLDASWDRPPQGTMSTLEIMASKPCDSPIASGLMLLAATHPPPSG